jgi:putative oxidoreductase
MLTAWSPQLLSILRIVIALLFVFHGTAKLFGFPSGNAAPLMSKFGVAGALEIVGGALLLLGLFTRPVAFVVSGEMAVAYFTAHAPRGLYPIANGGEAAVLFCFVFLYLAAAGGGPWSLDAARGRLDRRAVHP